MKKFVCHNTRSKLKNYTALYVNPITLHTT